VKIRIPETGEVWDVRPSAEFAIMAKLKQIEILPEPKPAPVVPQTTWTIKRAEIASSELYIHAECTCGNSAVIFSAKATSRFAHCGKVEHPPADLLARYEKLTSAPKPKKKDATLPSGVSFYVEI
jgi:hypothetical protein